MEYMGSVDIGMFWNGSIGSDGKGENWSGKVRLGTAV